MRLRQVALVAEALAPARAEVFKLLGLDDDFADEGVGFFGLENSVMTIGDTFLEIVAPFQEGTTAGRLLERRGGNGGYMVLAQVDDIEPLSNRIDEMGIRKVWEADRDEVTAFHVHPKDIGAAIVSFDEMRPAEEWVWAGPGWRDRPAKNVSTISAVTIQALDPQAIARRWSEAFAVDAEPDGADLVLTLGRGEIRIVQASDGRGDGVAAIQFDTPDLTPVREAADDLRLTWAGDELVVCGARFQFRQVP